MPDHRDTLPSHALTSVEVAPAVESNILTLTDVPVQFVALSKFVVANGMMNEVKEAFRNRPHLVDAAPGFDRLEVMVPYDNPNELWLVTYWSDEESYRVWHRSHEYHESHKGIPKGLKLVPRSAEIRLFEFVCS